VTLRLDNLTDVIGVHFHLCEEGTLTGTPTPTLEEPGPAAPCTGGVVGFILSNSFQTFPSDEVLPPTPLTGAELSGNTMIPPGDPVPLTGVVVRDAPFGDLDLVGELAGHPLLALVNAIKAARVYINVHTVRNPAGEIRCNLLGPFAP